MKALRDFARFIAKYFELNMNGTHVITFLAGKRGEGYHLNKV